MAPGADTADLTDSARDKAWLTRLVVAAQQRADQHAERSLLAAEPDGKRVVRDGRRLLNLAGNDYLALGAHSAVRRAAADAAAQLGPGSGASRLVTGTTPQVAALEQRFAAFKHAEAALLFPTGYMANLGVLTSLAQPGDVVFQDKLNHASLIDAARFSGATVRTFPHRGYDRLERLIRHKRETGDNASSDRALFIVTDAVFSMDGTTADLPRLAELADRYDAALIVDEAHATGVLGETGAGLAEAQGVAERIDVTISTASKALGNLGGVATATRAVIDHLINTARTFIYTTAPPPSVVAGIDAALDVVRDEPHRRQRLAETSRLVRSGLRNNGWGVADDPTPIVPLMVGDNTAALALSRRLEDAGVLAVAIRPPTVPPGSARVRLSLRADLDDADVARLLDGCGRALQ